MIGEFTEDVRFVRRGRTQDSSGSYTTADTTLGEVFAEVKPVEAREGEQGGRLYGSTSYLITFPADDKPDGLTTADHVVWLSGGNVEFNIRGRCFSKSSPRRGRSSMARRVEGGSKLRKQLRRSPDDVTEELSAEFRNIAPELQAALTEAAAKDTGGMSEQAEAQVSRDEFAIVAGYSKNRSGFKRAWVKGGFKALWQEFGTKHHPARPFISPTFRRLLPGYLDRIEARVIRTLKRAGRVS
jgi:hypothetical protein